ncbi:hypothetical protein SCUP234_06974 [Seiridium cupressi]
MERIFSIEVDARLLRDGWHTIKLAPLVRKVATDMLGSCLFGDLYEEVGFQDALKSFYRETIVYQAVLKIFPNFLKAPANNYITSRGRALRIVYNKLENMVESSEFTEEWQTDTMKDVGPFKNMIRLGWNDEYWSNPP